MTASPDYFFLDGQKLVATDNGDGTKTLVVSSTGGGGGAGAAGTPVLDNAGVRWLWIYDATAGTSTYISFVTGSAGTPTFPLTPDADTSVQVSNFPATQPVSAASLPLPTGAATEATLSAASAKLPATLGQKTSANSLAVVVASDQTAVRVISSVPNASSGTILGLTTNATGTTYTAFASQACTALDIVNNTGTTVEYRRGGAGTAMQIPTGTARMVIGITNANQVDVRRTDTSNTQVTLQAEAFVNLS